MDQLTYEVETRRVLNAVAAGTSDQAGTTVDMQGFDGVRAVALFGTLTTTHVTKLKAGQGDASDGSDAVDISGAVTDQMGDTDSNKMLVLDVWRPTKRYVTFTIDRGTANAVIDGMIVELYRKRSLPASAHSSVSKQKAVVVG